MEKKKRKKVRKRRKVAKKKPMVKQVNDPSTKTLDDLWVKVVRLMYDNKCAYCRGDGHDCHHIKPRQYKDRRWHPLNGVLLCRKHHEEAHAHSRRFKAWLKEELPAQEMASRSKGFRDLNRQEIKVQLLGCLAVLIQKTIGGTK